MHEISKIKHITQNRKINSVNFLWVFSDLKQWQLRKTQNWQTLKRSIVKVKS